MMKHFIPLRLRYGLHEVANKHCIYFAAWIEVAAEDICIISQVPTSSFPLYIISETMFLAVQVVGSILPPEQTRVLYSRTVGGVNARHERWAEDVV